MDNPQYEKGERVRHPQRDEWGIGEVLEANRDDQLQVFFENEGRKTLLLTHVQPERVSGPEAQSELLDNRAVSDASARRAFKSVPEMREEFISLFPEAFRDRRYMEEERNYKDQGVQLVCERLDERVLADAIDKEKWEEIVRDALYLVQQTNLANPYEKMGLSNGLDDGRKKRMFSMALQNLLYGSEAFEKRFDAFAGMLEEVGAAKWTIATYFPALRYPDHYIYVKPTPTKAAAQAAHFEIEYRSVPNSTTYRRVLKFAEHLRDKLSDLEPRDMIDIQSFMFRTRPKV